MHRINTTALVGASLAFLYAVAAALLLTPIAEAISPSARLWLILAGLVLSVFIAALGVSVAHRQSESQAQRLRQAHDLLASAAASLETGSVFATAPLAFDMDSFVVQLTRLVKQVQDLVEVGRQREREVMRADQLAMVGQMAAGVAHELRNPLTSIKMLVQSARKQGAPGLAEDDLAVIEHEIRRLERSLQRFLDFARPPRPERHPHDLTVIVERTLALIEGRARKQRVSVSFERPTQPVVVEVDEDQIEQLLLNLMLNSLDVMPDGGSLTVEFATPPGDQVELRVRDTGPGIPENLLPRLFDPFMSTKETGIGLGLAVSHRIAERHGGNLSADNQPDAGACFVLRLMRAQKSPTVA
jgi:two-component system, NtrC family, sensor histidine kinase HydH